MKLNFFLSALLVVAYAGISHAGFASLRTNSGMPPYIGRPDAPTAASAVAASSTTEAIAVYVPVSLTVTGIRFNVGTQSGNCQTGLYDAAGNLLASSAETACPSIGAQTLSFTSNATVQPGTYYLAIGADNTTQTFGKSSGNSIAGCSNVSTNLPMATKISLPGTTTANCFALVGLVSGGLTQ